MNNAKICTLPKRNIQRCKANEIFVADYLHTYRSRSLGKSVWYVDGFGFGLGAVSLMPMIYANVLHVLDKDGCARDVTGVR